MIRKYHGLEGKLVAPVAADSSVLAISTFAATRISQTFINGQDAAFLTISSGPVMEVVRLLSVDGNILSVARGEEGTTPSPFPLGADIGYVVTGAEVFEEYINEGGNVGALNFSATGLIELDDTVPGAYAFHVDPPTIQGRNGVEVIGDWPTLAIGYSAGGDCCAPTNADGTGGTTGAIVLQTNGAVYGSANGMNLYLTVDQPYFNGTNGITVSGEWPNFTISGSGAAGTVSSVAAGAGLVLTGSPTVNPTLSVQNTGVVAGQYGDFHVNARGQVTYVAPGFNPISEIVTADGTVTATRTGGSVSLDVTPAAIGVPGVAPLADPADPFNAADETSIATPAVVAKALSELTIPNVTGTDAFIGEADGDYTNTLSSTSLAISLTASQRALVHAEVTMTSMLDSATLVAFGMAVFDAGPTRIRSNRRITQNQQSMTFVLNGPMNTTLAIVTTTPPDNTNVTAQSLSIQVF